MPSFPDLLDDRGVLLADGVVGTNFQDMGIEPGVAPEEWVIDAPDGVRECTSGSRGRGPTSS